jgi:hypothetical protein
MALTGTGEKAILIVAPAWRPTLCPQDPGNRGALHVLIIADEIVGRGPSFQRAHHLV